MADGKNSYNKNDYTKALEYFKLAETKSCTDASEWVKKCNEAIKSANEAKEAQTAKQPVETGNTGNAKTGSKKQDKAVGSETVFTDAPLEITGIEFRNSNSMGEVVSDYSEPLNADDMKYLNVRLTVNCALPRGEFELYDFRFYIKLYKPDGTLVLSRVSQQGYTYLSGVKKIPPKSTKVRIGPFIIYGNNDYSVFRQGEYKCEVDWEYKGASDGIKQGITRLLTIN
jgi:hypothetical protein